MGQFLTTTLPIISADTGDFYISVQPVPIEAKPFHPEFLPANLENWSMVSTEPDSPQAIVNVEDINKYIRNYGHPIFLRSDEAHAKKYNLIIRFETPTKEPPFKAKLFVYTTNPEESIDLLPLTIEGIGGDGKKRNCTIYINHQSPKDLVLEGIIQARRGNYSESIRLFNKSIEINSSYALAWKNRGAVLSRYLNDYENAISCLNRSLELNSSDDETWNIKAFILCKLGYYSEALLCSEKAIQLDPKYAWAWNNKGIALRYLNKYNESIEAYDMAIVLDPKYADAWTNKGIALDWMGLDFDDSSKYDEAVQAFDKAIELNPKSAHTWYNKALALWHSARALPEGALAEDYMARAYQARNKSVELDPEYNRVSPQQEAEALQFRET